MDHRQDRWISIEAIAAATGISRRDLDTIRRHTSPDLRTRRPRGRGRRLLYAINDVMNWLNRTVRLNSAQRAGLIEGSTYLLPSISEAAA